MNIPRSIKPKKLFIHVLFWIGVWFYFVYFFSYNSNHPSYAIWFSSMLLPLTIGITYVLTYLLIPKYLLAKKYWQFALYSFYVLVFSTYIIVLEVYACFFFLLKMNVSNVPPMAKNFIFVLILVYLVVGIVSFGKILNHNFKTTSRNKELQNKILTTQLQLKEQELHYLKKQIHPHFLFNTLNTIYGFALKQSKQTPDIILKLSNLLDYILYQINKPKVSLKEEVLHIREYIELEKIRFQESLKVSFNSNDIDKGIQIAPMLLIPFVENAFKHGNLIDGNLTIEINIIAEANELKFSIKNSFKNDNTGNKDNGIGLENIRKRLDLNYSTRYQLTNEVIDNKYIVKLSISDLD